MRVAWFSPAAGNSGIVEYTRQILPALARHLDVDLWTPGPAQRPPAGVRVIDYGQDPARLDGLDDYDLSIFNLGNHLGFHRRELELSRDNPGVIILHDRTLHELWAGYCITHLGRPDLYAARMTALYGDRGAEIATDVIAFRGEQAWRSSDEPLRHSLEPDTLATALGAVVHSRDHAERLTQEWAGPVRALPFPAYPSQLSRAPSMPPQRSDPRLHLVGVGHVDRHKQIHATISTLRADESLARSVRFTVIGAYSPRSAYVRELHREIADGGLAGVVQLLGYQPPGVLQRYLDDADVFVNLRSPNIESGSASLMEQMSHGRPVVVYRSGSFAELPDDAVVKVPIGDENALVAALQRLAGDPSLRREIGLAARRHAESVTVEDYARSLSDFAASAASWRVARDLSAAAGHALGWLGIRDTRSAEMVATEIDGLLS